MNVTMNTRLFSSFCSNFHCLLVSVQCTYIYDLIYDINIINQQILSVYTNLEQ